MSSPIDGCKVLNVCCGEAISILSLARLIGEIRGVQPELISRPARPGDIRMLVGDPSLSSQYLGIRAQVPLRDGLASMRDGRDLRAQI
jgi:UDP-glucose 4-epimerase